MPTTRQTIAMIVIMSRLSAGVDKTIAVKEFHSVAVNSDGNVLTWGSDTYGELGQERILQSSTPNLVAMFVVPEIERDANYRRFGNEIIDLSGNLSRSFTDFSFEAPGFSVVVSRTYNSSDTRTSLGTSQTYDWAGNVLTATNELGNTTAFEYDKRGNLTKVTDALGGSVFCAYDRAGRKIAEVSPKNYNSALTLQNMSRTEFTYDLIGRTKRITQIYKDEYNMWQQFVSKAYTYDANGNILKEQDALGYTENYGTVYEYDRANRVTRVTTPEGSITQYVYDTLGRATTVIDANNVSTVNTYSDDGYLLTVAVGGTRVQTNTYDLRGNLLTQKDGKNNTTTFSYNDLGKIKSMTAPGDLTIGAYTVNYKYTKLGLPAQQLDSMGKETLITYDNQGRVLTTIERKSDGTESIAVSMRYDKAGNVRFQTDGNGVTTELTYNALNRNVTSKVLVTDILDSQHLMTTTNEYDANGNVTSVTDWRGNIYSNEYDALDRLIATYDPSSTLIEKLTYNDNGEQIESTDSLNKTTQFVYDKDGRLKETIDPLSYSVKQFYDGVGNVVRTLDGNNNQTTFTYDSMNRLRTVKNALNEITAYTYNSAGNMLTQTDGEGNVTTMQYNVRNLPTVRIDPGGISGGTVDASKAVSYTYNPDGTAASMTDKNGVVTSNIYDIHGRLLTETAGGETVSYTYDNNGNQLTVTNAEGTITRTYDELGRVKTKNVSGIGTTTIRYDVISGLSYGETKEITTDPKGNVTTRMYDANGRLAQVIVGNQYTSYEYYSNGSLKKVVHPNGVKTEYTYYDNNRLRTLASSHGFTTLEAYNYAYDGNGNLTTKLDIKGRTTYTYDALGRLETATEQSGKVTEHAGNRSDETVTDGNDVVTTVYNYNEQNRLMSTEKGDETTSYYYDNNGNLTGTREEKLTSGTGAPDVSVSDGGEGYAVYEYDKRNRMIYAKTDGDETVMAYNGEGLRIRKEATKDGATAITKYVYEYDKVILELDSSGNETASNVYANGVLISRSDSETGTMHYLYNGHGDVTGITESLGNVVMSYYYDAFGVVLEATGNVDNSYMYSGYQYDAETGFYYLNSRYYDPATARFISADTYLGNIGSPLSLNLYTYCHNNPVKYWDPTGHAISVRDLNDVHGNSVTWKAGEEGEGNSTITITTPGGITQVLTQGEDFYIGSDGKAYYSGGFWLPTDPYPSTPSPVPAQPPKIPVQPLPGTGSGGSASPVTDTKSTDTFSADPGEINYGSIGTNVKILQELLKELGYYKELDEDAEGVFGENTLAALIRFQLTNGLSWEKLFDSSGKYFGIGPSTLAALGNAFSARDYAISKLISDPALAYSLYSKFLDDYKYKVPDYTAGNIDLISKLIRTLDFVSIKGGAAFKGKSGGKSNAGSGTGAEKNNGYDDAFKEMVIAYIKQVIGNYDLPLELALATAHAESEFRQYFGNSPMHSGGGVGIMQIQADANADITTDYYYDWHINIDEGLKILERSYLTALRYYKNNNISLDQENIARSAYVLYNATGGYMPSRNVDAIMFRWKNPNSSYAENDKNFYDKYNLY